MVGLRRSGRIAKEIAIVLLGTDTGGRVFSEDTTTVVLSRHGAGILSKHRLAPDEILTIRFRGGSAEAPVRLVGEMGKDVRGYTYGVAFVDPDLDFWELKFPPPPRWPGSIDVDLECSACQSRDVVDQTEVEADVYTLAGYILRFCPRCGTSTEWRRATSGSTGASIPKVAAQPAPKVPLAVAEPKSAQVILESEPESTPTVSSFYAADSAELEMIRAGKSSFTPVQVAPPETAKATPLPPVATGVVARSANRRRDVRTRVSCMACIRQSATEEVVECDNMSKGGLSFRSRKSYAIESTIEVAVPYAPGSPAIFVVASIRHAESLSVESLFRYGAAYKRKGAGDMTTSFER